jgi:1-acyl-sn-glycerol-3-phosphate acyltransferase
VSRDLVGFHLVRSLLAGVAFVSFWTGGVVLAWVVLPVASRRIDHEPELRHRCQGWLQRSFVAFHDVLRGLGLLDYDPRRVRLGLPEGPCVVIANHPTIIDAPAIISVESRLACVVKRTYYHRLGIGRLLRCCGYIDGGDEASPMASALVAVQAMERLEAGQPVLFFPEGTRSPAGGLGTFQRGAFEVALRSGTPIVPVIVTCDPPVTGKGQHWYEMPSRTPRLEVKVLDASAITRGATDSRELASRFQDLYLISLNLEPFRHTLPKHEVRGVHGRAGA